MQRNGSSNVLNSEDRKVFHHQGLKKEMISVGGDKKKYKRFLASGYGSRIRKKKMLGQNSLYSS
jgi:hypothetical protein